MIVGIGIDMIEVDRVLEKIDKDSGFKQLIFSENEIAFCDGQPAKGESYAARFAAKEAFLKATGLGLTLGHKLAEIEVAHDGNGKPMLNLLGNFKVKSIQHDWNKIHLSISHLKTIACAVVIIEQ
ncbi:MAG: holo-ACP synthase [Cyclobacteriaceae bacterium]|nr:holo-ACP synthase [Cyclobacteriaceae bacterium]MDH5249326.1 holo-ACP synthase [Cyclobacteriaceae bacterium]